METKIIVEQLEDKQQIVRFLVYLNFLAYSNL